MNLGLMSGLAGALGAGGGFLNMILQNKWREKQEEEQRALTRRGQDITEQGNLAQDRHAREQLEQGREFESHRQSEHAQTFSANESTRRFAQEGTEADELAKSLGGAELGYAGSPREAVKKLGGMEAMANLNRAGPRINPIEQLVARGEQKRAALPKDMVEARGSLGDGFYASRKNFNPNVGMGSMYSAGVSERKGMGQYANDARKEANQAGETAYEDFIKSLGGIDKLTLDGANLDAVLAEASKRKKRAREESMAGADHVGAATYGSAWRGLNAPSVRDTLPPPLGSGGRNAAPKKNPFSAAPANPSANPFSRAP